MTQKKKDILVAVLFIALGAFIFMQSMGIEPLMNNDVGSGFFPKVVAIVIIAIATAKLIITLKDKDQDVVEKTTDKDMAGGWITVILIGIYVLVYQSIGFLISTAVYLFLQILVLCPKEKRNIPVFGLVSIITPVFIYTMFVYLINMPLPKGIFGF
jgi:putative tricarboxylic transport membrane protein